MAQSAIFVRALFFPGKVSGERALFATSVHVDFNYSESVLFSREKGLA